MDRDELGTPGVTLGVPFLFACLFDSMGRHSLTAVRRLVSAKSGQRRWPRGECTAALSRRSVSHGILSFRRPDGRC